MDGDYVQDSCRDYFDYCESEINFRQEEENDEKDNAMYDDVGLAAA